MTEAISDITGHIEMLTNIDDIREYSQKLDEEETRINAVLDQILLQKGDLVEKLGTLDLLRPDLEDLRADSSRIFHTIHCTSQLAEKINAKVRTLDQEKSRVKSAIQYVDDVQELKRCVEGIQEAMQNKEYNDAAQMLQKARRIDPEITNGSLAEFTVPTSASPDHPAETLDNTKKALFDMFSQHFDDAVMQRNEADITRYFKLFPLVGCQAEGLDKYMRYVCNTIKAQCAEVFKSEPRSGRYDYSDSLNALFEIIKKIVRSHGRLVEAHYGKGKMLRVIQRLQEEINSQCEIILNRFIESRELESKLVEIQASSRTTNVKSPSTSTSMAPLLDPRQLMENLNELKRIIQQCTLINQFMHERASKEAENLSSSDILADEKRQRRLSSANGLLLSSGLETRVEELLRTYRVIDEHLMYSDLCKAIESDDITVQSVQSPFVDDVFYIFGGAVSLSVSTYNSDAVASTVKTVLKHMDKTYIARLRRLAEAYMADFRDNNREESMVAYMIMLNNLNISAEHTQTLPETILAEVSWADEIYKETISRILEELRDASTKFEIPLQDGLQQLFERTLKTAIRPLFQEAYRNVKYVLSEDEYRSAQFDQFLPRFKTSFGSMVRIYKKKLKATNFDTLMSLIVTDLAAWWKKIVMQTRFSQYGSIQFDKDLGATITFLSKQSDWMPHNEFTHLRQISRLLNFEEPTEIYEYWDSKAGPLNWRLTVTEIKKVLGLRLDFDANQVANLSL